MVFFSVFLRTLGFLSAVLIFLIIINILLYFSNDLQKKHFVMTDGTESSNNIIAKINLNGPLSAPHIRTQSQHFILEYGLFMNLETNNEITERDLHPIWLQELNQPQQQAVTNLDGPLLVLSGAGTGKTRVLTSRLAQLIATRTANPFNILAVTFTNKAAREMRIRAVELVGPMAEQITLGTFHSVAAQMLRRHAELVSLKSNFTILDTDDQLR